MRQEKWFQKEIDELIEAVSKTSSKQQVVSLFENFLTPREINDIARRYSISQMLKEGRSYHEIQEKLLAGPGLISKVSAKIGYGFRRSNSGAKITKLQSPKAKSLRKTIRYKGAPGIIKKI